MKSLSRLCLVGFLLAPAVVAVGCAGDGDDEDVVVVPKSARGESCEARNDCEAGLRCVNQVCSQDDFAAVPTALNCDLIECQTADDCCGPPPAFCVDLEQQCNAGDQFSCDQFEASCTCSQFECQADRCVSSCVDDFDCPAGTCQNGTCVQGGTGCTTTSDCPYFHRCENSECVDVGCQTDRECAAITQNGLARCVEGECSTPCTSDAECNGFGYAFQACINLQCVYVGCETDEECRIFLNLPPGAPQQAVCR